MQINRLVVTVKVFRSLCSVDFILCQSDFFIVNNFCYHVESGLEVVLNYLVSDLLFKVAI